MHCTGADGEQHQAGRAPRQAQAANNSKNILRILGDYSPTMILLPPPPPGLSRAQQLPPLGLHRLQKEQQTSLPKIPTFKGQTEIGRRVGGKGGEGKGGHGAAGSAFLLPISQMECISSLHPTISQEIVTFHKFCTTLSDVYSKKH